MAKVNKHKGREVITERMKLTGAGDGLSQAMTIEPLSEPLSYGDRVLVLIEAIVTKDGYEPATPKDYKGPLAEVTTLKAEAMKLTSLAAAQREMDKFKGKLDKANEVPGQQSIDDELDSQEV